MDWSNENYVRVYTRDTGDLLAVGWEGRSVLWELMRKADLAGVIDHGGDIEIVAEMLRMPHDMVARAVERLAARGVIILRPTAIVIKNYRPAQEALKSDKQRQRESRAARLARALADGLDLSTAKALARPDVYGPCDPASRSQDVTASGHETGPDGHARSQPVTDGHVWSLGAVRCVSDSGAVRCDLSSSEVEATPDNRPPKVEKEEPWEATTLADRLRGFIAKRQPGAKEIQEARWTSTRKRWAKEFRLAHTADERTWPELREVLDWCQRDPFWQANILSAGKFRDQFDTLKAQMKRPTNGSKVSVTSTGWDEDEILVPRKAGP